jgi:hypothetical protein
LENVVVAHVVIKAAGNIFRVCKSATEEAFNLILNFLIRSTELKNAGKVLVLQTLAFRTELTVDEDVRLVILIIGFFVIRVRRADDGDLDGLFSWLNIHRFNDNSFDTGVLVEGDGSFKLLFEQSLQWNLAPRVFGIRADALGAHNKLNALDIFNEGMVLSQAILTEFVFGGFSAAGTKAHGGGGSLNRAGYRAVDGALYK